MKKEASRNETRFSRRHFILGTAVAGASISGKTEARPFGASLASRPDPIKVPTKKLGATGVEVPILGMGGSQKFDPKYDKRLHRAFALGITYFDTSERYSNGQSEKTLGTFMEQVADRKKIWITSKVSYRTSPAKAAAPPEHFKKNLERCLKNLRTDYLDMFFIHGLDDERFLEPEYIRMSESLKKAKKINFFGFSCHAGNLPALLTKASRVGGIDAIMFRYNFRAYGDLELNRAIDAASKAGIGLIAMKTMGSIPEDQEKVVQFRSEDFTLPQAKLKSIWADERIDACVSEMENVQMVMENSKAALSTSKLAFNEFLQLNRLAAQTAPFYCQGCRHLCETKVEGDLNIADTMRYLMYHESYGQTELACQRYNQLDPGEREFEGKSLEAAAAACPQGIDLAQRLAQADELLKA